MNPSSPQLQSLDLETTQNSGRTLYTLESPALLLRAKKNQSGTKIRDRFRLDNTGRRLLGQGNNDETQDTYECGSPLYDRLNLDSSANLSASKLVSSKMASQGSPLINKKLLSPQNNQSTSIEKAGNDPDELIISDRRPDKLLVLPRDSVDEEDEDDDAQSRNKEFRLKPLIIPGSNPLKLPDEEESKDVEHNSIQSKLRERMNKNKKKHQIDQANQARLNLLKNYEEHQDRTIETNIQPLSSENRQPLAAESQRVQKQNHQVLHIPLDEIDNSLDIQIAQEHQIQGQLQQQTQQQQQGGNATEANPQEAFEPPQDVASNEQVGPIDMNENLTEEQIERARVKVGQRLKAQNIFLGINAAIFLIIYLLVQDTIQIVHVLKGVYGIILYRIYNIISKKYERTICKVFTLLNWICFGFYVLIWDLKAMDKSNWILTYCAFPGVIMTLLFWAAAPSPKVYKDKSMILMERTICWLQAVLLGIRLDGVELPWLVSLLPLYCGLVTLILISLVFFCQFTGVLLNVVTSPFLTQKQNTIGSGWNFMLSLLSLVWLGILLNIEKGLKGEELYLSYDYMLLASLSYIIFVYLYECLFRKFIRVFINLEIQNELGYHRQIQPQESEEEGPNDTLQIEEVNTGNPYVWMISSTFFSNNMFQKAGQNKEKIKEWKKKVKMFKASGHKSSKADHQRNLSHAPFIKNPMRAMSMQNAEPSQNTQTNAKEDVGTSKHVHLSENDVSFRKEVGDIDSTPKGSKGIKIGDDDDFGNMCIICCEKKQEAVMKDCGHGGFCYPCAYEAWHKNNTCPICRKEVSEILIIKAFDELKIGKILGVSKKVSSQDTGAHRKNSVSCSRDQNSPLPRLDRS